MSELWRKFLKLFEAQKPVPPPINRKDRRVRESIARRQRSLHIVSENEQLSEGSE